MFVFPFDSVLEGTLKSTLERKPHIRLLTLQAITYTRFMRTFLIYSSHPLKWEGTGAGKTYVMKRRYSHHCQKLTETGRSESQCGLSPSPLMLGIRVLLLDETEPHSLCSSVICKDSQKSSSLLSFLHKYLVAESSRELSNHEDLAAFTEEPAT